tara:strand:- start:28636 stop:29841 length:1206 start_codon:yes stop_codon:yes gene_type:complete
MNYKQASQYIDELEFYGMKLGLGNITELCGLLDNPQNKYSTIHVAGTNGKGSVVAMIDSVLRKAGYKVGMYTSPHLQDFRERIQFDGKMVSKEEMAEVFVEVKKAADEMKGQPTYFEFTTAMAFLYFQKKNCDVGVIEVGLGGRLDATNTIEKPLVSVITNIGMEHEKFLGDTKEKIAEEKAGIVKKGGITVIGEDDDKIRRQLIEIAKSRNNKVMIVKENYKGKIGLLGEYQKRNAAIAVETLKALKKHNKDISDEQISKGIAETKWAGRLEVMQENPRVIIDGAHNPSGAEKLGNFLSSLNEEVILVIGMSQEKNITKVAEFILPHVKKIIITKAKYRGMDCGLIEREVVKYNKNITVIEDVKEAVNKAIEEAEDETVLVTGSLFAIGEARELWFNEEA